MPAGREDVMCHSDTLAIQAEHQWAFFAPMTESSLDFKYTLLHYQNLMRPATYFSIFSGVFLDSGGEEQ